MGFELPSKVFKNNAIQMTLGKIKTENKSIGQHLGMGSTKTEKEKKMYESRKKTLETYKSIIIGE